MRNGARSFWLSAALALAGATSSCTSPSPAQASAGSTASAPSRRAEYQQYLIKVASDTARWKSYVQGINPHTMSAEGAAVEIDENLAAITKDLETVQAKIQALAQRETLGGDIELLTGLQSVSSDAARLEPLLPLSQKSKAGPVAAGVVGAGPDQVREIRKQAAEDASGLQTESTALARNARADEARVRWQFKDLVELVKALAWPVVLALALVVFRKPMSRFVE